jgi:hypothetical protein
MHTQNSSMNAKNIILLIYVFIILFKQMIFKYAINTLKNRYFKKNSL